MAKVSKKIQEERKQDAIASAQFDADRIGLAMTLFVGSDGFEHRDASNPKARGPNSFLTVLPSRYHTSNAAVRS